VRVAEHPLQIPKAPDQCIFKAPGSIPESYDGMVDLLLVLHFEGMGSQDYLNVICDFLPGTFVKALEAPDHLEGRHKADAVSRH
jgi:hypothetical protein